MRFGSLGRQSDKGMMEGGSMELKAWEELRTEDLCVIAEAKGKRWEIDGLHGEVVEGCLVCLTAFEDRVDELNGWADYVAALKAQIFTRRIAPLDQFRRDALLWQAIRATWRQRMISSIEAIERVYKREAVPTAGPGLPCCSSSNGE